MGWISQASAFLHLFPHLSFAADPNHQHTPMWCAGSRTWAPHTKNTGECCQRQSQLGRTGTCSLKLCLCSKNSPSWGSTRFPPPSNSAEASLEASAGRALRHGAPVPLLRPCGAAIADTPASFATPSSLFPRFCPAPCLALTLLCQLPDAKVTFSQLNPFSLGLWLGLGFVVVSICGFFCLVFLCVWRLDQRQENNKEVNTSMSQTIKQGENTPTTRQKRNEHRHRRRRQRNGRLYGQRSCERR